MSKLEIAHGVCLYLAICGTRILADRFHPLAVDLFDQFCFWVVMMNVVRPWIWARATGAGVAGR